MISRKSWVTPPAGIRIHKRGLCDFGRLYKEMQKYLEGNGYKKVNFQEKEVTAKDKALGKDIKVVFRVSKPVDDYAKYQIDIEMVFEGVEKVKQNNSLLDKGNLVIKLKGFIMLDYKNKWHKSKLGSFMNFVYNNYLIRGKIENNYMARISTEVSGLQNLIKNRLGLYS